MTALRDYFRQRGVPLFDITSGIATPVQFTEARAEHMATRRTGGLFDFSFMICVEIRGRDALACLHRLQTRNLTRLTRGRIAYTLMPRPDGTVINDATVWCFDRDHYALFTGRRSDLTHAREVARHFDVKLTERSDDHAVIAVQGVCAWRALASCVDHAPADLPYFGFWSATFQGRPCWVARIGYSGEAGYEIVVGAPQAPALWEALRNAGATLGLTECGFEAANSLRIEAGHILFSAELAQPVTPDALGLRRLVNPYLLVFKQKSTNPSKCMTLPASRLVGLLPERHGGHLNDSDCAGITGLSGDARVTSACYSPLFNRILALGFVAPEHSAPGTRIRLAHGLTATVARLPFYDPARMLARRTR